MKPRIFISAVTKELKTARQLVANTLLALGFEPVWQDIFETHSGDIRPMLREKLDTCSAVLQIVGDAYGAEPPAPDEQFGRVSYTQYEALYARSRGKKVYYLVAEANLPRDCPADQLDLPRDDSDAAREDSATRKQLQQDYRSKIQSTEHIFYAVQTESETELTVRRLKSDLEKLRRWFQTWMFAASAAILLSLFGVAWVLWSQQGQAQRLSELQKQANNPERTRQQLETTILRTYEKAVAAADKLSDWRKREDAKELAKSQRDGNLARVDEFLQAIATVINSGNASPEYLEMTRIFNEQGAEEAVAYIASRKQDLLAKSRASKEVNRQTNLLPILEQARKQILLGQYEAARQTCDDLLAEDPAWGDALHEQIWILIKLGDLAHQYETVTVAEQLFKESHHLAEDLARLRDPHPQSQRDLSASTNKLGDVLLQLGKPQQALAQFEAGFKINQRLAATGSADHASQRDLSVSHNKIGDALRQLGQLPQALAQYKAGLKIRQTLAAAASADIQSQRDLSVSYNKIGDVLRQLKQSQQALEQYEAGLKIRQTLAVADPRDLSVSHIKLGDVLMQLGKPHEALLQYEAGLKIRQTLATADPSDAQTQRDLSISHERLGDVLLQLGQLQQALEQYEAGQKIRQALATADPRDAQAQRDVSISHDRFADVLRRLGMPQQALTQYQAGLKISLTLAAADPSDAQAQRDVAVSHYNLGKVANELDDFEFAKRSFAAGIALLDEMIREGRFEQSSRQEKSMLEVELAKCNLNLNAIGDWNALLTQPASDLPYLLTFRCVHFAKKGNLSDVQQAAEKLLTLEPKDNGNNYNAACGFGLCLKLVSGWTGKGPFPPEGGVPKGTEEEQRLRKEHRAKAIAALKEAIALGWNNFEHLRKDQDLAALHGDPEFEALFPKPEAEKKPAE